MAISMTINVIDLCQDEKNQQAQKLFARSHLFFDQTEKNNRKG